MKKKFIPLFMLMAGAPVFAQQSTNTAGGDIQTEEASIAYSFGQHFIQTSSTSLYVISEGVQQPHELSTNQINHMMTEVNLSVYPNPSSTYLNLTIDDLSDQSLRYQLFNLNGEVVLSNTIDSETTTVSLEKLSKSVYFLQVLNQEESIKTFKIIKK